MSMNGSLDQGMMLSVIKSCTINVTVTQNNLLMFCLLAKSSATACKLILSNKTLLIFANIQLLRLLSLIELLR